MCNQPKGQKTKMCESCCSCCSCCWCNLSAKKFAFRNSKRHLFQRESVCPTRQLLHPSSPLFLGFLGMRMPLGYCKCSQLPMWVSIAFALNEHKLCTAQKAAAAAAAATQQWQLCCNFRLSHQLIKFMASACILNSNKM